MTDNQLINMVIRQTPAMERLFDLLSTDQKREVLRQADGSDWHLIDILEDVREEARQSVEVTI